MTSTSDIYPPVIAYPRGITGDIIGGGVTPSSSENTKRGTPCPLSHLRGIYRVKMRDLSKLGYTPMVKRFLRDFRGKGYTNADKEYEDDNIESTRESRFWGCKSA